MLGDDEFRSLAKYSMADEQRSQIWFDACHARSGRPGVTAVECGVGPGGRLALAALAFRRSSAPRIIGFDRFEAPLEFSQNDTGFDTWERTFAKEQSLTTEMLGEVGDRQQWINRVKTLVLSTGYGGGGGEIDLVAGDLEVEAAKFVAKTNGDFSIDLLSVSCNFYGGVQASVKSLFPFLSPGSFVMLDGYYYWGGFKAACNALGVSEATPGTSQVGSCMIIEMPA